MISFKKNISNLLYLILLLGIDYLVLVLSMKLTFVVREQYSGDFLPYMIQSDVISYLWITVVVLLVLFFENIYTVRYDFWSDTKKIYKALLLSFVGVLTVITLTKISTEYSRAFIVCFFALLFITLPLAKRYTKKILFKAGFFKQKIKIVGNSSLVKKLENEMEKNWYFGFDVVTKDYSKVIILSKNIEVDKLQELIKKYSKKTKDIYLVPYMYHLDFTNTTVVDYFNVRLSAIHIENRLLVFKNVFLKSFIEKMVVVLFFPFALVIHIIVSLLIKIDSSGSVFFKQKRLGENGELFTCYKYRTMFVNGDEILNQYLKEHPEEREYYEKYHKYINDPRITKIGKILRSTSLDEFPQFFNILKGDMNLIGPRPYMVCEQVKIGKYNEEVILAVKPGITGLWQVSGRNDLTFAERIDLDFWYIQNWSLWMDFVIFMKTIKVVLGKVGAR